MNGKILILRPEPGASETAAKAKVLGLEPVLAPILTTRPLDWEPPDPANFDALLLTSANAARLGGSNLHHFTHLPCYAVGQATGQAARAAGFRDVRTSDSDGLAALALLAADNHGRVLHPCGRDHVPIDHVGMSITRRMVYAAEAVTSLPDPARAAIEDRALVLLHSPRSASVFARLAGPRPTVSIAAISQAAADAVGIGWKAVITADRPRDEALLELAAKLCQTGGPDLAGSD